MPTSDPPPKRNRKLLLGTDPETAFVAEWITYAEINLHDEAPDDVSVGVSSAAPAGYVDDMRTKLAAAFPGADIAVS